MLATITLGGTLVGTLAVFGLVLAVRFLNYCVQTPADPDELINGEKIRPRR